MPLDFDTFLICVLALFGGISFTVHRRRRHDYALRLGGSATSLPVRSNRTLLLLGLLATVAIGGVVLGTIQLLTVAGLERLTGLAAISGAILFFTTAYRESAPLVGPHGFAIPYYNLFLPWSAIESISYDGAAGSGVMTLFYRSSNGTRSLQLRPGLRTAATAVAVMERLRAEHEEANRPAYVKPNVAATPST